MKGFINKKFIKTNITKYKIPINPPFSHPFSSTLNARLILPTTMDKIMIIVLIRVILSSFKDVNVSNVVKINNNIIVNKKQVLNSLIYLCYALLHLSSQTPPPILLKFIKGKWSLLQK